MGIVWPDSIDEILGGDAAAGLAYLTPARGIVITPMAPIGLRDREAGTVTVTTSLGLWKKVERIRANPSVAVAFHAREHGFSERSEFVLAQGTASIPDAPDRKWLESIQADWERFLGPTKTGLARRLLEVYYYERVPIEIDVERLLVWPDLRCTGAPEVIGAPLPDPPGPQEPPANGTEPRVDVRKLAKESQRLPHTLLGWCGADGLPVVVAARMGATTGVGAELELPSIGTGADRRPFGLDDGGRRAGLLAHKFAARMVGQEQRIYTGWLEVAGDRVVYKPHTRQGYALPASEALFVIGAAFSTRRGIREARRRGLAPSAG